MENGCESLMELGLTETEAGIYLAGLGSSSIGIHEIAQKTKIKRPTIYHAMGTLKDKGLVSEKRVSGKLRFEMSSPEHIRGLVERQKEAVLERAQKLETLIPLLVGLSKGGENELMNVVSYDGIEGMKTVMDIAFYARSKHWDIIAPLQNFLRDYDEEYAKRYLNARKYHGITARTLWEFTMPLGRELTDEEVRARNPRFMPAVMQGKFKSMMILFDDKIAIFSSYEKLSAILITSAELKQMFQAMFDGIWEFSEKY